MQREPLIRVLRVFSVFALFLVSTQAAATTWSRTFGGTASEQAHAVANTADGGYIVAGETSSFGAGGIDAWLIKLDGGGNLQWEQTYGGTGTDRARSVRELAGGGYVFAGETTSFGAGLNDMWVVVVDPAGNVVWENTYGSATGNEIAYSVREKPAGGYVVTGHTDVMMGSTVPPDVLVLDLNGAGGVIWQNVYGGMNDVQSEARAAALFDDNSDGIEDDGVIVAGLRLANLATHPDFWVVKVHAGGVVLWERFFDSGLSLVNGDMAYAVQQTSDDGFIVSGETPSNNADFWVIKLDALGNVQWQTSHGSASGDASFGVQETSDGGYIAAGFTTVNGNDAFLIKLDSMGVLQWQRAYGGNQTDQARAIEEAADNGFIVAGFTDSFGAGGRDLWVYKTDVNGDLDPACPLTTHTNFMLTSTALGTGNTTALFSAAGAATAATTAATGGSSPTLNTQCAGITPANTRATQAAIGDHEQECALAVDPGNVNNQTIVYMDDPAVVTTVRFPSLGVSFTNDGGVTWFDRQIRFGCDGLDDDSDGLFDEEVFCDGLDDDGDTLADEDLCCNLLHIDPSIAADSSGNLYSAFIAYEPAATSFQGSAYVVAAQSADGGNSWTTYPPLDQTVFTPPSPPNPLVDFLDKSWITVDNDPGSPRSGTAYVAWQRDDSVTGTNSNVWVSSLAPGATTWSGPVRANDPAQLCADAPYPVAGLAGDLWLIWRHSTTVCGGPGQFWIDLSTDGGMTWTTPDIAGRGYTPIPQALYRHFFRTSDFPFLTVDPTNPNTLFVVYAEDPPGPDQADVMFTMSTNGGATWLPIPAPVRVNKDPTLQPQYFPVVRAKQNMFGWTLVDVLWADERNTFGCDGIDDDGDLAVDEELANNVDDDSDGLIDEDLCDIRIDIYFARSVDTATGAPTFGPGIPVTLNSFGPPGNPPNFLGDYIDLATAGSDDYAAWADTRGGDNDIYWDRIVDLDSDSDGFPDYPDCNPSSAGVFAVPGLVQNLQVSPVAAGTNVTVSWMSQDPSAGTATVYDIVTGLISQLRVDGNYSRASCLTDNHPDTPYTDTRTPPPAGDAYYYLMRAHNSCGVGSFGSTSPVNYRSSLDSTTPCPF